MLILSLATLLLQGCWHFFFLNHNHKFGVHFLSWSYLYHLWFTWYFYFVLFNLFFNVGFRLWIDFMTHSWVTVHSLKTAAPDRVGDLSSVLPQAILPQYRLWSDSSSILCTGECSSAWLNSGVQGQTNTAFTIQTQTHPLLRDEFWAGVSPGLLVCHSPAVWCWAGPTFPSIGGGGKEGISQGSSASGFQSHHNHYLSFSSGLEGVAR